MALIEIMPGVFTSSQEAADLFREEQAFEAFRAEHGDVYWNPVEGKWEL